MRCLDCGGTYKEETGILTAEDKFAGKYNSGKAVPYFKCDSCGQVLLTPEAYRVLDKRRNEKIWKIANK